MNTFNPSDVGKVKGDLFGFPYSVEHANVVVLPVPWDVTTSYKPGTSNGPEAILKASPQLDFFDIDYPELWNFPVAMAPISNYWVAENSRLRAKAESIISGLEAGRRLSKAEESDLALINERSRSLHDEVKSKAIAIKKNNQFNLVLGGEHSVAYGNIAASKHVSGDFGLLQIDAHQDLRDSYLGFAHSHASVMNRVLNEDLVTHLVQVGIRDCSPDEMALAKSDPRVVVFENRVNQRQLFGGTTWKSIVDDIISRLPQQVYLSIDIDGLEPQYCPNTGTPVPGGLTFDQLQYLLFSLGNSGKRLVGADLVEVAPGLDEWDANVGSRVLLQMIGCIRSSLNG